MKDIRLKKKIISCFDENTLKLLVKHNAMLAGGAILSLIKKEKINDFDLYFRSKLDAIKFTKDLGHSWCCVSQTDRSLVMSIKNNEYINDYINGKYININIILLDGFDDLYSVFKNFDFTICMCGYDFKSKDLCYNKNFWQDVATNMLRLSGETKYPLGALYRVEKYIQRGYTIDRIELLKLFNECRKIKIETIEDLQDQIGSLYGVDFASIEIKDDFSIDKFIEIAERKNILLDNKKATYIEIDFISLLLSIKDITIKKLGDSDVYLVFNQYNKLIYCINSYDEIDGSTQYEGELKLYKRVKYTDTDNIFKSCYYNFKYTLGEYIESGHGLYCSILDDILDIGDITLELIIPSPDFIHNDSTSNNIRVTKAFVNKIIK